jgi:tRNA pseudouridine13 synthase
LGDGFESGDLPIFFCARTALRAMKVKQQPDDFRVEELTTVTPSDRGPFAFYRLEKRGWTTPDALAAIRRRWQIAPRRLNYGGLKDRHAETVQYLTIYHGPRRGLNHNAVTLHYLGQVNAPYSSRDILANRFQITLRELAAEQAEAAVVESREIARDGIPNYFDDQRFGSVAGGGGFVARHMVLGQFEEALRLALMAPYEFDPPEEKRIKATLLECWGRWAECKEQLPRSHARSLVDYLVHHPTDFRGTLARMRPELQGLYLSAYQSHLWNRILAEVLTEAVPTNQLRAIRLRLGELPAPAKLDEQQRDRLMALAIPLPAARWPFDADAPWSGAAERVLAADGLTWGQLKIRGMRKPFFTRGDRAAMVLPQELTAAAGPDERQPGRAKLELSFDLPRGSYATMVVKRLRTADPAWQAADGE